MRAHQGSTVKNYLMSLLIVQFSIFPVQAKERRDSAAIAAELIGRHSGRWIEIGDLYQEMFTKEGPHFHKHFLTKLATKRAMVKIVRAGATRVSLQIGTTTALLDFFDPAMRRIKVNNHLVDLENASSLEDLEQKISRAFAAKSFKAMLFEFFVPRAEAQDLSTMLLMVPLLTALMGGGPMMTLMSMTLPAFALAMRAANPPPVTGLSQQPVGLGAMFGIR